MIGVAFCTSGEGNYFSKMCIFPFSVQNVFFFRLSAERRSDGFSDDEGTGGEEEKGEYGPKAHLYTEEEEEEEDEDEDEDNDVEKVFIPPCI